MCVCPVVARVRVGPITVFESVSAARPPPPHPPASLKMLSFGNACGRSPRAPAEAPPPRAERPRPRCGAQPRLLLSLCGARGAHDGALQGWSTVCAPVQARRLLPRAWELAVHSIKWAPGDQIITVENEYGSNYLGLLHIAKRKSLDLITVPCDEFGVVSLNQLEKSITSKTKLIALTHIASQRGDIQPAPDVGAIAKKNNVIFLLDACQSVGQINLDTKELKCDFLCGSGRKYLRGPRGTGFLFVNNKILQSLEPIFLDLHSASWRDSNSYEFVKTARMFECYERNVAAMIGLSTAVQYLSKLGINAIEERTSHLSSSLIAGLSKLKDIKVLEKSRHRSSIITFTKGNIDAKILREKLKKRNINVSVCKQQNSQLDLGTELTGDVTRVSLHYYNTQQEISEFLQALEEIR